MVELHIVAIGRVTKSRQYLGQSGDAYVTRKAHAKVFTSYDEAMAVAKREQAKLGTSLIVGVRGVS